MPYQRKLKANGPNGAWEPSSQVAIARKLLEDGYSYDDRKRFLQEMLGDLPFTDGKEIETHDAFYRYVKEEERALPEET